MGTHITNHGCTSITVLILSEPQVASIRVRMHGDKDNDMPISRKTGHELGCFPVPVVECFVVANVKRDVNYPKSVVLVIFSQELIHHCEMGDVVDRMEVEMEEESGGGKAP